MSNYKGQIGTSMIVERKKKRKAPLKKNEKWNSSTHKCPQCKNSVAKYTKIVDGKAYCVRCFVNYNQKVEMVK